MKEFYISRISASGNGKPTSSVDFSKGFNIIKGPSNTGKTYIFACIDYIFGSDEFPIEERLGFDEISMQIVFDNKYFEITRDKDKKYFIESSDETLIESGKVKGEIIKQFFLYLMGIDKLSKIYSTQKKRKQAVTFRSFLHLSMIAEENIITKDPILFNTKSSTVPTVNLSILLFLLYGINCDDLEKEEDIATKKIKRDALRKYIQQKLYAYEKEKIEIQSKLPETDENKINEQIDTYLSEVAFIEKQIDEITNSNKELAKEESNLNQLIEKNIRTLERYKSLESQYEADLKRLDFILEGEHIEGELSTNTKCPFCDNELHIKEEIEYKETIKAERKNTQELLMDLRSTINSLDDEITNQTRNTDSIRDELNQNRKIIDSSFAPKMRNLKAIITQLKHKLELESKLSAIQQIAETLGSDLESTNNEENQDKEFKPKEYFHDDFFNQMSLLMKDVLENSYPGYLSSYFDKDAFDIVVNAKTKKNEGKGYRAFLNTFVCLNLRKYMLRNAKYSPSFMVIDSPILSLRQPERKERISEGMKSQLFKFMDNEINNLGQVIIIENTIPDVEYKNANIISFSGDKKEGRYGFLYDVY